ncbi:MAG: Regulatory protein AtoC [Phycisphaerae bacterium]|nr:Regulatory protein AtoC [Phycisphaerae bacterium]
MQTTRPYRVLVVDDSLGTLEVVQRHLSGRGYRVFTANTVPQAVKLISATPVDLVITDLKLPGPDGMDLVRHVRENLPDAEVMIITGYASLGGAIEAVKSGAEEYLAKPFTERELASAVERSLAKLELRRSSQATDPVMGMPGLIGQSPQMREVYRAIRKAAPASATVLITGESGTGKELVARAIHYLSERAAAAFVPVNCGSIPEGLLESELFGHVKGAFTGAGESRAGFLHAADGGSLFLDEIGEMSLAMQVKLLRVLQDQQVYMVGSNEPRQINTRVLAATNKDLSRLVEKGIFRQDLFYRLNVIVISIPPLRDRGDDVLVLAHHFAGKFRGERDRSAIRLSNDVLKAFRSYTWPGNVRELENLIHRLSVMTEGEMIEPRDLPSMMRFAISPATALDRPLAEVEAEHVRNVLIHVNWNRSRAAQILRIDRKTLIKKIADYGLRPNAEQ